MFKKPFHFNPGYKKVPVDFTPGDIKCHYCGVKNLCELPYDLATAEFINCPKSCMKFDG